MSNQLDCGLSLKDDIASILTDPTFHDVIIACSDGVEIGACRAILASRSPFFKAMLYGNMQKAASNKIILCDIKSATLHVVLQFIHTENIDSTDIFVAIDVYHAANFLRLPNLKKLVLERADDIKDLEVAVSLLNEFTVSLLWSDDNEDLCDILLRPFYTRSLAVGDLNGLAEDALELLLVKSTQVTGFNTPEYDLLLCIIEWAWTRNATAQSATERRAIFGAINLMPSEPSARILLGNDPSRALLLKMMQHVNLTLICPHRLKSLNEAVDVLTATSPQYLTFCHIACKNIMCPADHPSEIRGNSKLKYQWDQPCNRESNLVLSEKCTVVEMISGPPTFVQTSTPCVADLDGFCEWDIVVESMGLGYGTTRAYGATGGYGSDRGYEATRGGYGDTGISLGLVSKMETHGQVLVEYSWGEAYEWDVPEGHSWGEVCEWYIHSNVDCATYKGERLGICGEIRAGDVVTLRLNMNDGTCAISINKRNCGVAWTNLPRHKKLYPSVSLCRGVKYRIRPHYIGKKFRSSE